MAILNLLYFVITMHLQYCSIGMLFSSIFLFVHIYDFELLQPHFCISFRTSALLLILGFDKGVKSMSTL